MVGKLSDPGPEVMKVDETSRIMAEMLRVEIYYI